MTTQSNQVIVLRDGEGNYYLISGNALQAARLPDDKKQALEQALQSEGDVSGFFFDANFQNNFANIRQSNQATGANILYGGIVAGNSQNLTQFQGNVANVGGSQRA